MQFSREWCSIGHLVPISEMDSIHSRWVFFYCHKSSYFKHSNQYNVASSTAHLWYSNKSSKIVIESAIMLSFGFQSISFIAYSIRWIIPCFCFSGNEAVRCSGRFFGLTPQGKTDRKVQKQNLQVISIYWTLNGNRVAVS